MNARDVLNPADMGIQCGRKSGTVGSAVPGSALRMVRPETLPQAPEDVAPGESGRILIGGEIMQGYLGREDLTARAVVEQDGIRWHVTQDTGRLDEDGFLVLEQAGPAESGCKGRPAKKIRVRLEPENREVELTWSIPSCSCSGKWTASPDKHWSFATAGCSRPTCTCRTEMLLSSVTSAPEGNRLLTCALLGYVCPVG